MSENKQMLSRIPQHEIDKNRQIIKANQNCEPKNTVTEWGDMSSSDGGDNFIGHKEIDGELHHYEIDEGGQVFYGGKVDDPMKEESDVGE